VRKTSASLLFFGVCTQGPVRVEEEGISVLDRSTYGVWSDGAVRSAGVKKQASMFPQTSVVDAARYNARLQRSLANTVCDEGDVVKVSLDCNALQFTLETPTVRHTLKIRSPLPPWVLTVNFGSEPHRVELVDCLDELA